MSKVTQLISGRARVEPIKPWVQKIMNYFILVRFHLREGFLVFYDSIRTRLLGVISILQRSEFTAQGDYEDSVQITQQVKLEMNPMA